MYRTACVAFFLLFSLTQAPAADRLSVIELFTSQGCSSCPAADKLLGELAKRQNLIALSLPVDYWDYIGWKDTLASPAFSARQRAYAHARDDRAVYTPQAVVNGVEHRVGSDRDALAEAVRETGSLPSVAVAASISNGKISVEIGEGDAGPAHVVLMVFEPSKTVAIDRGENAGRTITYHNVVRRIIRIGEWNGQATRFMVPMPPDGRRCAIILQTGTEAEPGAILGAAVI